MEKIKVRCYKAFGNVYPGVYNYPVYYFAYEGWSNKTFATCIHCGECVVAFQRFCEVTFSTLKPTLKTKINAFQNLEIGGDYWRNIFEESYTDWLSQEEYTRLNVLFQKRHLLAHTEGIVDQRFIDKSGEINYSIGQRIVINEKDIVAAG